MIIDKSLGTFRRWRKSTTGLSKKYKKPVIKIGKKIVEKKIPMGWNKNEIFVETQMMVKINKICINQYWSFLFDNVCTSISIDI